MPTQVAASNTKKGSTQTIRVLHLEDRPHEAELIRSKLEERFSCDRVHVATALSFESALDRQAFDLILCAYPVRDTIGTSALATARRKQPDTPVIVLIGETSEELAEECLTAGAIDYILTPQSQRLASAVGRAVRDARETQRSRQTEDALRLSEDRLKLALDASDACVWEYDLPSGDVLFAREFWSMLGYSEGEVPGRIEAWEKLTHLEDLPRLKAELVSHYRGQTGRLDVEYRIRTRAGAWHWVHTVGRAVAHDAAKRVTRMVGTHRDITQHRDVEETLRLRELAIDAATNAILIADAQAPDCPIVYVNRAFEKMTGYRPDEVIGRNCRFLQGKDSEQAELERIRQAVAAGTEVSVLLRNYCKDGTLFWNSLQVSPVRSAAGAVTHFVGIQSDVTELKNYQLDLEYRANFDPLTGLANRNLLNDRLGRAIASAKRAGTKVAVMYIDLDRLKIVTDSLGHTSGDVLIKIVAERLLASVRQSDTVARLVGSEFAVMLAGMDHQASLQALAQKMLKAVEKPVTLQAQEIVTSASIGLCFYPEHGDNVESLLKNADTAMSRAKHGGGNQICFYTEELNKNALGDLRLEAALRRALTAGELELHYQPRVALASGRITSLEALIRWRHPEHGLISPARFIPLAEETGLIVPVGEWVLRTACQQMGRWRDAGHDGMHVAVNLSPRQFRQPDLVAMVRGILAETRLDARHLELEITEGAAMQDAEQGRLVLQGLKDLGVYLAIDDFGTGYSSLAYLKRFPIDFLKIDQSFIRGIPNDEDDYNIVRAIIALGRSLKLILIAEGVETEQQRAHLHAHGCHEMQGYLFSKPKPASELDALLIAR